MDMFFGIVIGSFTAMVANIIYLSIKAKMEESGEEQRMIVKSLDAKDDRIRELANKIVTLDVNLEDLVERVDALDANINSRDEANQKYAEGFAEGWQHRQDSEGPAIVKMRKDLDDLIQRVNEVSQVYRDVKIGGSGPAMKEVAVRKLDAEVSHGS